MPETTPQQMAAGFDNLLITLQDELLSDLPDRIPKRCQRSIEKLIRERIDQARDGVADFFGEPLEGDP